jgi:hypothetical protein
MPKKSIATGKARKKAQAISALLEAPTIREAAQACGLSLRTLQRWLAEDEAFQTDYARAKRDLLSGAINRLRCGGIDAAGRLHAVINDKATPPAVLVSAAGRLLALLLEAAKFDDLSTRLDRLETLIEKGD